MEKILTPTDFGKSIGGDLSQIEILFSPDPDFEPEFRRKLDSIFNDLPYIDAQDPSSLACYLDSIEMPLSLLRIWGIQLVAVQQRVKYPLGKNESIPMVKTI